MDALQLANSLLAQRGRLVDTLDPALGLHPLRDAVRELFAAAARREPPEAAHVALVNGLARAPSLAWRSGAAPRLAAEESAAEAARTAIELLAGGRVRMCGNPRCVQFFLAEGRREFCSAACSNRTRVARHTARHR